MTRGRRQAPPGGPGPGAVPDGSETERLGATASSGEHHPDVSLAVPRRGGDSPGRASPSGPSRRRHPPRPFPGGTAGGPVPADEPGRRGATRQCSPCRPARPGHPTAAGPAEKRPSRRAGAPLEATARSRRQSVFRTRGRGVGDGNRQGWRRTRSAKAAGTRDRRRRTDPGQRARRPRERSAGRPGDGRAVRPASICGRLPDERAVLPSPPAGGMRRHGCVSDRRAEVPCAHAHRPTHRHRRSRGGAPARGPARRATKPDAQMWIGCAWAARAASLTASSSVGWGWQMRPMSSLEAPNAIAAVTSAISVPASGPRM